VLTLAKRGYCICGHSPWSHRVAFYDAQGNRDDLHGKLHEKCERTGCRCLDYTEAGVL
jgi:hypothetical protein